MLRSIISTWPQVATPTSWGTIMDENWPHAAAIESEQSQTATRRGCVYGAKELGRARRGNGGW